MKPSVIVWDLETVPDLGGFAAANDLVGRSEVEVREAIGDKFPKAFSSDFKQNPSVRRVLRQAGETSMMPTNPSGCPGRSTFVSERVGRLGMCPGARIPKSQSTIL